MTYKRGRTQTSTQVNLESSRLILDFWYQTNICNSCQPMGSAASKINLELARKILAHRISYKETCNCFSIGSGVKLFVWTDACEVTAHNISDGIATSFSCRQTCRYKSSHYLTNIFQLYPM